MWSEANAIVLQENYYTETTIFKYLQLMYCNCKSQWLGLIEPTATHLLPHVSWKKKNVRKVFYRVSIFMTIIFLFKFKDEGDKLSNGKNNGIKFDQ